MSKVTSPKFYKSVFILTIGGFFSALNCIVAFLLLRFFGTEQSTLIGSNAEFVLFFVLVLLVACGLYLLQWLLCKILKDLTLNNF